LFDGHARPRVAHLLLPRREARRAGEPLGRHLVRQRDRRSIEALGVLAHHARRVELRDELRDRVLHLTNPRARQAIARLAVEEERDHLALEKIVELLGLHAIALIVGVLLAAPDRPAY